MSLTTYLSALFVVGIVELKAANDSKESVGIGCVIYVCIVPDSKSCRMYDVRMYRMSSAYVRLVEEANTRKPSLPEGASAGIILLYT